jgi:hypothetical protein
VATARAVTAAGLSLVTSAAPARAGERYSQSRALLSTVHRTGTSRSDALDRYEEWLRLSAAHGTSKDLQGATEATIQAHLKDGDGFWTWLESHGFGGASPGSPFVALSRVLGLPPRSMASTTPSRVAPTGAASTPVPAPTAPTSFSSSSTTTPRSWNRQVALAAVTTADETKLATIGCAWTQGKVRALVGVLRLGAQGNTGTMEFTIGAQVFDRVIGGRPPPASALRVGPFPGTFLPPRATVIQEAERLGYLQRLDQGIRRTRASRFRVTLT